MLVGLWGPFNKQDGCSVNSWIIFLLFFPFLNLLGPFWLCWQQFNFLQPEILPPHTPPPSLLSDMSSLKLWLFFFTNLTRVKYWHFRMSTNVKADFKQEHMLQTEVTPRFVIIAVVFIAVSIFVLSSLPLSSWHGNYDPFSRWQSVWPTSALVSKWRWLSTSRKVLSTTA